MKTKWLWTCWWKWWWRWRWRRWRWWCGGGGGDDGGGGGYVGYWYVLILMIDFSWQRWFWWCWWSVMTCIWGPCSHIFATYSPDIHQIFTTYSPTRHIDNDHHWIIMTLAMGRRADRNFGGILGMLDMLRTGRINASSNQKNQTFNIQYRWISFLIGGLEHGFYDFTYTGNVIIPTDELIFSEGLVYHQPDNIQYRI